MNKTPVSIGLAAILSGPYAELGLEMKQAAEMAVAEAQAEDSSLTIRVHVVDDRADINDARNVAFELCEDPGVVGVVGHFGSDASMAAAEVYRGCDLAMITPIASNPALTDHRLGNVFRFTNRDDCTGRAIANYLYKERSKRSAVVVATQYPYGRSMAQAFREGFAEAGGKIVEVLPLAPGETRFEEFCSKLPEQFDVIFYAGAFEGAPLLHAVRARGFKQLFATGDGCWDVQNFVLPAGGSAEIGEGVLVLSATPSSERSRPFVERYSERYGPPGNYAINSYDATRVLLAAIRAATRERDNPTRTEVLDALRRIVFQGIAYEQPVRWDENGDNTAAVTALYTIRDGQFVQLAEIARTGHVA